jgi:uncharacterized protein (TIGR00297 family)
VTRLTLAPLSNFDIAAVVSALIAVLAYRTRALGPSGAFAALAVGTATYGALGVPGAGILLAFFVTSIALSRLGRARKSETLVDVGKTGPRDGAQVVANGGVAALAALAALWIEPRFAYAFAGAFAAATADTWGTEIGTLARRPPRSIFTLRPVATGLSGGITLPGMLAEVAGALWMAALAVVLPLPLPHAPRTFVAVALGGIAGALADSLLGGSLQALRFCPQCRRATEREPHGCGANTRRIRGLGWLGNDGVNFAATLVGAAVAFWVGA